MADLFAELDEVMRQERMEKVWHDYGHYIIGFIVGTILLTASISGYKSWNTSVQEKQTAQVLTLQGAADYPQNVLDTADLDLRGSLKGLTLVSAAGTFADKGQADEALALYERAAADSSIPAQFSHLAALMVVRYGVDVDGADAAALLAQMKTVYSDAKSPWAYHARLEAAVIEAHLNMDYEAARVHLNVVRDTAGLPKTLTDKAQALDHVYGLKMIEQNKGAADE
jgi:hypothetical protein